MLLDEPFEGLAPVIDEELIAAIKLMLSGRSIAIILVEQHTDIALELTNEAIVLERGRLRTARALARAGQGPTDAGAAGRVARGGDGVTFWRPAQNEVLMANPMIPRERADYSAIVDRPPLKLPGNARIVFWTIVNYEVWYIGKPMARQLLPAPDRRAADCPTWCTGRSTNTACGSVAGASTSCSRNSASNDTRRQCAYLRGHIRASPKKRSARLGVHGPRL